MATSLQPQAPLHDGDAPREGDGHLDDADAQPQAPSRDDTDDIAWLSEEARAVRDVALQAFDQLNTRHGLPVTRLQWRCWMEEHEEEFRGLMKSAPRLRRGRSHRVRARDGIPAAAPRIHVQRAIHQPIHAWSRLLWMRSGWHGVRTGAGVFWAFLYRLHADTMYLDLSSLQESPTSTKFTMPADFRIQDHLHTFAEFERRFQEMGVMSA